MIPFILYRASSAFETDCGSSTPTETSDIVYNLASEFQKLWQQVIVNLPLRPLYIETSLVKTSKSSWALADLPSNLCLEHGRCIGQQVLNCVIMPVSYVFLILHTELLYMAYFKHITRQICDM